MYGLRNATAYTLTSFLQEGGTGTGKSIAFLLTSLELSAESWPAGPSPGLPMGRGKERGGERRGGR